MPTSPFAKVETRRQPQRFRDRHRLQKIDGQCCGNDIVPQQARKMSQPFVECARGPTPVCSAEAALIAFGAAQFVHSRVDAIESLRLETKPAESRLETRPAQCDAAGTAWRFLELMGLGHAVTTFHAKCVHWDVTE